MIEIRRTPVFGQWLKNLRDRQARARILDRIERMGAGNFGDVKSVGGGVSELRVHYGPGYRVYFTRRGDVLVLLLTGGDKSSQDQDIIEARRLAGEWKADHGA